MENKKNDENFVTWKGLRNSLLMGAGIYYATSMINKNEGIFNSIPQLLILGCVGFCLVKLFDWTDKTDNSHTNEEKSPTEPKQSWLASRDWSKL